MKSEKRSGKLRLEFIPPKESPKKERERVMGELLRVNSQEKGANTTSNLKKGMV